MQALAKSFRVADDFRNRETIEKFRDFLAERGSSYWSPKASLALKILRHTVPNFSVSEEAARLLRKR